MKVVIAPDSFKDALAANAAALHIANGVRSVLPDAQVDLCPVADGGEGFSQVVAQGSPDAAGMRISKTVDSLGRPIEAGWVLLTDDHGNRTAVVELAAASGLERLAEDERDPTSTSTFGTGTLIRQALENGPSQLLLGIGGSATNDAGCGIAQALGVRFFDKQGDAITSPITGGMLLDIGRIESDGFVDHNPYHWAWPIQIACDVDNILTGPTGAAYVFASQKGASPAQVEMLEEGVSHVAELWRQETGIDPEPQPGAGAAGGVGGGLVAMLGAKLVPGAELVLDMIGFNERIKGVDLVITGEGRLDKQSLQGKAAMQVAKRASAAGVPCIALVGSVGAGAEQSLDQGLTGYRVIGQGLPLEESIRRTGELLERAAAEIASR